MVLPVFLELGRLPSLQEEEVQKTVPTVFPLEPLPLRVVHGGLPAVAGVSGLAREHYALQVSSFARGRDADQCSSGWCRGPALDASSALQVL